MDGRISGITTRFHTSMEMGRSRTVMGATTFRWRGRPVHHRKECSFNHNFLTTYTSGERTIPFRNVGDVAALAMPPSRLCPYVGSDAEWAMPPSDDAAEGRCRQVGYALIEGYDVEWAMPQCGRCRRVGDAAVWAMPPSRLRPYVGSDAEWAMPPSDDAAEGRCRQVGYALIEGYDVEWAMPQCGRCRRVGDATVGRGVTLAGDARFVDSSSYCITFVLLRQSCN